MALEAQTEHDARVAQVLAEIGAERLERKRASGRLAARKRRKADPSGERKKIRQWCALNPERVKQHKAREYSKNRAKYRNYKLQTAYGLTAEQRDAMLAEQGGRCKVVGCRTDEPGKRGWATDHNHQTGKVRGVLCSRCNLMLGLARDNPDILRTGADYLECA